jgi:hypothetical protein
MSLLEKTEREEKTKMETIGRGKKKYKKKGGVVWIFSVCGQGEKCSDCTTCSLGSSDLP